MKSRHIIKRYLIGSFTSLCLLFATQVHADFRKALDAYIARDGDTMIKEVKEAVDAKNDDGLMLLLMATNMDAATSDYDETTQQSKSTLRAILPQPKWDEIRELLVQATNNSTVDAQYALIKSSFGKDIVFKALKTAQIKRGEVPKSAYSLQEMDEGYKAVEKELRAKGLVTSEADFTTRAEAGDYAAQQFLGLAYLHYTGEFVGSCDSYPDYPACKSKDETKGYEWLKKSALAYERNGLPINLGIGIDYSVGMCDFYRSKPDASPSDLRQAFLWCMLGFNSGSTNAPTILRKMDEAGNLKIAAPEWYEEVWKTGKYWEEKRNVHEVKEWPELLLRVRKEVVDEAIIIFNYRFRGDGYGEYELDVYDDGRVFINPKKLAETKVLFTKIKPNTLKKFITDLRKIGFDRWPLSDGGSACDMPCKFTETSVMLRTDNTPRRIYIFSDSMERTRNATTAMIIREAQLKVLLDTYFPSKQLRIDLGNSDKIKQRLRTREAEWIELAKIGEQK